MDSSNAGSPVIDRKSDTCVLIGKGPSANRSYMYAHMGDMVVISHAAHLFTPEHLTPRFGVCREDAWKALPRNHPTEGWFVVADSQSVVPIGKRPTRWVDRTDKKNRFCSTAAVHLAGRSGYKRLILVGFDGGFGLADKVKTEPNPKGYDYKVRAVLEAASHYPDMTVHRYPDIPYAYGLHLGCGRHYLPGWTNVDKYAERADEKVDLDDLQLGENKYQRALCVHVIEHLPREVGIRLVENAYSWLKPGGFIEIEAPCRSRCLRLVADGRYRDGGMGLLGGRFKGDEEWAQTVIDWAKKGMKSPPPDKGDAGMTHLYVWDEAELKGEMEKAGFRVVVGGSVFHGQRHHRDFRLVGFKPDARLQLVPGQPAEGAGLLHNRIGAIAESLSDRVPGGEDLHPPEGRVEALPDAGAGGLRDGECVPGGVPAVVPGGEGEAQGGSERGEAGQPRAVGPPDPVLPQLP